MDEMTQVRRLRADAPAPDRARLVAGRERLLQAAETRPRMRVTARRRLTVVGAAAAVVVAVLATAQLPDGGDDRGAPPASQGGDAARSEEARMVLRKAARAAAARPDPEPRTGEWVYVSRFYGNEDSPGDREVPSQGKQEDWYPWRELEAGWRTDDVFSYRERYVILGELPGQPEKWFTDALGWLQPPRDEKSTEQQRYWVARNLLGTPLAPPDGLAKLYRALADMADMRVLDHPVTDATGEKAVAVYLDSGGDVREEILLDPQTYRLAGFRSVQLKDAEPPPDHPDLPVYAAGDVVSNSAVVEVALVDREGQRP